MKDYPNNIFEFQERFATEEACFEYLEHIRWPNGFCCPCCSHNKAWVMKRGLYWCRQCNYQVSLTAGTIFQGTRKPLRLWFQVIWHIVAQKNGVSALGLQRVLGFTRYETVWTWLHKLRAAMVRPGRNRLLGTVEVDETYIGGKKPGKRGRGAYGKALVLIAVEDKDNKLGRIRLRRIHDASAASLTSAIQDNVEPGSTVRTDGWNGYAQLMSKGYGHEVVNHHTNIGENLLPLAHRVAGLLKTWIGGTHQGSVSASHLDYYLDEFTFRFNRRTSHSRGKLFYRLIEQAVTVRPLTAQDIHSNKLHS